VYSVPSTGNAFVYRVLEATVAYATLSVRSTITITTTTTNVGPGARGQNAGS